MSRSCLISSPLTLILLFGAAPSALDSPRLMAEEPSPVGADAALVRKLIEQLKHHDEVVRKAAGGRLGKMPEAIPTLRQAVRSDDLALFLRAEPALREALLTKHRHMAKDYPVDLFLERMLILGDPSGKAADSYDEEAFWQVAAEIAGRVRDLENQKYKQVLLNDEHIPIRDFAKYRDKWDMKVFGPHAWLNPRNGWLNPRSPDDRRPENERTPPKFAARSPIFSFGGGRRNVGGSFVASLGQVSGASFFGNCVVFSGEAIELGDAVMSIIIAAGDVEIEELAGSIVLANGTVTVKGRIDGKAVVRAVKQSIYGSAVVIARDKVVFGEHGGMAKGSVVRTGAAELRGWIRFFEIGDVGVEVATVDRGIKVMKVLPGTPLDIGGLRAGDVITSVGDEPVKDVEQFRILLRRAAARDVTIFTARRDGQTRTMGVSYTGWEPPAKKL